MPLWEPESRPRSNVKMCCRERAGPAHDTPDLRLPQIETKKKLAINAIPTAHTSERSIAQSAR